MNGSTRFALVALLLGVGFAPVSLGAGTAPALSQTQREDGLNFGRHYRELGIEGSIVIYDLNAGRSYEYNRDRNNTPFPPASTFKIPNSLIALETGAIANDLAILTWDGVERELPNWNRDLNLREAFKLSAVWFYQVLARRIGYERMQDWVNKIGYGDRNIGSKDAIDKFWLEGPLKITPQQQIEFLRRLYRDELPFSKTTMATVKDIAIVERTPDYTLRAKTGWLGFGQTESSQIGWYVGYLERDKNAYIFATNIDIRTPNDAKARAELTRRCLKDLGVL